MCVNFFIVIINIKKNKVNQITIYQGNLIHIVSFPSSSSFSSFNVKYKYKRTYKKKGKKKEEEKENRMKIIKRFLKKSLVTFININPFLIPPV